MRYPRDLETQTHTTPKLKPEVNAETGPEVAILRIYHRPNMSLHRSHFPLEYSTAIFDYLSGKSTTHQRYSTEKAQTLDELQANMTGELDSTVVMPVKLSSGHAEEVWQALKYI